VSGHQRLAGFRQLPQKTDPDAGRLLGVVLEGVVPVGVVEPGRQDGVADERQPVAAGRQADHAVPRGVAAGATDDHPRRHLVLRLERPQLDRQDKGVSLNSFFAPRTPILANLNF
jgi:hypothetical protein